MEKEERGILRDYCEQCGIYLYDNPLPVASGIVVHQREVLLVKRGIAPSKGEWCLPMGFAESGESIRDAALRELEEEAGIKGEVTGLVDIYSGRSDMYGDLLHVTYEIDWKSGEPVPGDDATEARFFPLESLPHLPFYSNRRALEAYVRSKQEYWSIIDSFKKAMDLDGNSTIGEDYLSDRLVLIIEENAETIARKWYREVSSGRSTPSYSKADKDKIIERALAVIKDFRKWLSGEYGDEEIRTHYRNLGATRREEGFRLSEVLSAISLTRKHVWEFALSRHMWKSTIDIYMTLELERRMMLFFDKASYHAARGYEG